GAAHRGGRRPGRDDGRRRAASHPRALAPVGRAAEGDRLRGAHGRGRTRAGVAVARARAALPARHRVHDRHLGARDGARRRPRPRAERRAAVRGAGAARVVRPQAVRVALPGIDKDFIALLKDSSLVSVITVVELTKQMTITAVDVRGWLAPGLLCAALYLALSYPLSRLARRLERRLAPAPA